ncbi:MAG: type I methionyl aminopeptidase [Candidatus Kerfeldbacteria bacterium RIFCSPHIGHO2_12_FULL_48_17]|uniref:Methionine aminopeptidase n=1 Tax=Candidatus Kerfeldbacteria bacterium RIFCSPHIGHO2_12_FULL_48_17 TaxID=1798542 RepID=A0A1G2B7Q9_9BACT|nr:MAG: type I methionyl aminopeptidase [Candidatus Kerfeldbacteria bacterium RIFCSPHIGHO2_12_FULL_48_17]
MIRYKTPQQIRDLQDGGKRLAESLQVVVEATKPGITTQELDEIAAKAIRARGGKPSFLDYEGFPKTLCASINQEVVHGIPSKERVVAAGDIIGLDLGLWYKGLCTDMAVTIPVGKVSKIAKKLIKVTKKSLEIAIAQARPGNTTGDIGHAVQAYAESHGFGVVRDLAGHGVGFGIHEEPLILNYGHAGSGEILKPGLVIAIEPMLTVGDYHIKTLADDWTIETIDGNLAAQFEKTLAITADGPVILTQ